MAFGSAPAPKPDPGAEALLAPRRSARRRPRVALYGAECSPLGDHFETSACDYAAYAPGRVTEFNAATREDLERQVDDLAAEFRGLVSHETVDRVVAESVDSLGEPQIDTYIPVLAYRFSRERLLAIAQAEGAIVKEVPEVLFVCVHNAGRSQMAAALLNHRAEGRVHVRSAGSDPADRLNSAVVEAMEEIGIDVSEEFPKPLTDEVVRAADAVITMGCGDACPIYPGKMYRDWELDDPAGKGLEDVRKIRDVIDASKRFLQSSPRPTFATKLREESTGGTEMRSACDCDCCGPDCDCTDCDCPS
jgi:arsenate reductase